MSFIEGNCIKGLQLLHTTTTVGTYSEAAAFCLEQGGRLAIPRTKQRFEDLSNENIPFPVYIGLTDKGEGGTETSRFKADIAGVLRENPFTSGVESVFPWASGRFALARNPLG